MRVRRPRFLGVVAIRGGGSDVADRGPERVNDFVERFVEVAAGGEAVSATPGCRAPELAGRGAGRGGSSSAVVMGLIRSGSWPAAANTARANPYQLTAPGWWCGTPRTRSIPASPPWRPGPRRRSDDRSGRRRLSVSRSSATAAACLTMLPCRPHTHDVRAIVQPGSISDSPPSLLRLYTDCGLGRSHRRTGGLGAVEHVVGGHVDDVRPDPAGAVGHEAGRRAVDPVRSRPAPHTSTAVNACAVGIEVGFERRERRRARGRGR